MANDRQWFGFNDGYTVGKKWRKTSFFADYQTFFQTLLLLADAGISTTTTESYNDSINAVNNATITSSSADTMIPDVGPTDTEPTAQSKQVL